MWRYLRRQPPLRMWVLPTILFQTLKDQDFAQVRWRRRSMKFTYSYRSSCKTRLGSKIASKRLLRQWPRLPRLPMLNKLLGALWLASLPWKRMQLLVPVALIQQDLGICLDRVPAPQPLGLSGPMALDHLMTTGRQDADLILPQAVLMNMREVPSYYDSRANNTTKGKQSGSMLSVKKANMPADKRLVTIHCKAGSTSVRLVFESRAKCQDFLLSDIKIMASLMRLTVPFATPKQLLLSANLRQLKTDKLENNLHLCGESWLTSLKFSSLIEMTKVHLSSQRSTLAHISSASKIEEMELENQCSNLLLLEAGKLLHLLHLSCPVPGVPPDVLQHVISQANRPNV